jgi:GNAT superfamily N-acetyltransferase
MFLIRARQRNSRLYPGHRIWHTGLAIDIRKRGQAPEYDPPHLIEVRDAVREDAPAACEVIKRSISELCEADHRNDPEILRRWLANKTPEIVGSWIIKPGNSVLVAVDDDSILAVGSVTDAGEITLNYVSPDARFRGVSRAMLTALEARALERGTDRCTLLSTERLIAFPVCRLYRTALHNGNSAQRRATRCRNDSPDKQDRG